MRQTEKAYARAPKKTKNKIKSQREETRHYPPVTPPGSSYYRRPIEKAKVATERSKCGRVW